MRALVGEMEGGYKGFTGGNGAVLETAGGSAGVWGLPEAFWGAGGR